jgi:phosphatidylserine decarboxylase
MRIKPRTFIIAKEGWVRIAIALIVWLIAIWIEFLPWVFFLIFLSLIWLYRNPERIADEDDPMAIVAPIDGKICAIKQVKVAENKKPLLCIQIEGSFFGAGFLRAPRDFSLKALHVKNGLNLPFAAKEADVLNSCKKLLCETKDAKFTLEIQAGPMADKIYIYPSKKPYKMGERIGFALGSKISLYLPYSSRIRANIGDKVYGGESVVGYFQSER